MPANDHDMPRKGGATKPRPTLTIGVHSKMPTSISELRPWVHEHFQLLEAEESIVDCLRKRHGPAT